MLSIVDQIFTTAQHSLGSR